MTAEESTLRSSLHEFVSTRDRTRQHLLQHVADKTGKFRKWEVRSGDVAPQQPSKTRQRLKDVTAGVTLAGTWLRLVLTGKGFEAARDGALRAHAKASDRLTVTGLTVWLDGADRSPAESEPAQQLRGQLLDMLRAQEGFLTVKLARSREICGAPLEHMSEKARAAFAQLEEEKKVDESRLRKIQGLLSAARRLSTSTRSNASSCCCRGSMQRPCAIRGAPPSTTGSPSI